MTRDRPSVLVLGGYGVFGGHVARMLARDRDFRVLIAGRSAQKAGAFAEELRNGGDVTGIGVDIANGIQSILAETGARLVIHAAGPFQGQDYGVAEACIAAGADYIDLADGRAFVDGFGVMDERARRAGVLAVTGASSVPGLSSAVADHLSQDLAEVHRIAIAITPGNRAPRGRAVVAAVLGLAGREMPTWDGGRSTVVRAWGGLRRHTLRLPDGTTVGPRWFADWDVPDNVLFPARYRVRDAVQFRAGLELGIMHLGLWALSWAVRSGVVRSLAPLTPIVHAAADMLRPFGTDRGGMFVEMSGIDHGGRERRRRWTLIAGSGDGPRIPAVPAAILARKRLRNQLDRVGATPCLGQFSLGEFEDAVSGLDIRCAIEDFPPA